MQKTYLNVIKESLGDKNSFARVLAEALSISQDSAYRRIRDEIPLTFDEIVKLCKIFHISFDEIFLTEKSQNSGFRYSYLNKGLSGENFPSLLKDVLNIFDSIHHVQNSHLHLLSSRMSLFYIVGNKFICKFLFNIWFGMKTKQELIPMEKEVPLEILENLNSLVAKVRKIPTTWILPPFWLQGFLDDISFCKRMGIINNEALGQLKLELLGILSKMESDARNGRREDGAVLDLYLSQIFFDGVNVLVETPEKSYSVTLLHEINYMFTDNRDFAKDHKEWMHYIQNNSICISRSNPFERKSYFEKQRKLIEDVLKNEKICCETQN